MKMIVKGIKEEAGLAVVRLQFLVSGVSCRETYLGPERVKENFDYVRTRVMCKTRMCAVSSTLQENLSGDGSLVAATVPVKPLA
jgi:hypothetical protein